MCDSWPSIGSTRASSAPKLDTSSHEVVALLTATNAGCQHRGPERWLGMRVSLQRAQRRDDEQDAADERGDRIPGQAEDEGAFSDAERDRLPRPHCNAPEHLFHAQFALDPTHEIVRSDRDAAGRDHDVRSESSLERNPVCGLGVFGDSEPLDTRSGALDQRPQHDPVRLVDLTRTERLPRSTKLRPGDGDRDLRRSRDRNGLDSARGKGSEASRRQPRAGDDEGCA